jgi:hypothetical protein
MIDDNGTRVKLETGATRENKTYKGRYDLLPREGIHRTALRFEQGALKYADRDW